MFGQAALEGRLSRRGLAFAARDDVAHDAFVDERRIETCPLHRFTDDHRAQCGRGEILERAEELAGWQPDRADDNRFSHE